MKGILIAIEGTDGSGKGTQVQLLKERFEQQGKSCTVLSFPQYGKKSAGLVEEYLNGKFGGPEDVDPYAASLFFALDRFDASFAIKRTIDEGNIVLLDRYIDSNIGHQGGKIDDENEREKYLVWLYDLEFRILKNPRPDLTLILHVPPDIGQVLVKEKKERAYIEGGKTHDIHEANLAHLQHAERSFLWLAEKFPHDHHLIECYTDRLLSIKEIHANIWNRLAGLT